MGKGFEFPSSPRALVSRYYNFESISPAASLRTIGSSPSCPSSCRLHYAPETHEVFTEGVKLQREDAAIGQDERSGAPRQLTIGKSFS